MRRVLFPITILALAAACNEVPGGPPLPAPSLRAPSPADVASASIPPRADALTYFCSNGQVVQAEYFDEDETLGGARGAVRLYIDGQSVRMIRATSAIGDRYIGSGLQWWVRGLNTATLAPLGANESTASDPGTACRSNG